MKISDDQSALFIAKAFALGGLALATTVNTSIIKLVVEASSNNKLNASFESAFTMSVTSILITGLIFLMAHLNWLENSSHPILGGKKWFIYATMRIGHGLILGLFVTTFLACKHLAAAVGISFF